MYYYECVFDCPRLTGIFLTRNPPSPGHKMASLSSTIIRLVIGRVWTLYSVESTAPSTQGKRLVSFFLSLVHHGRGGEGWSVFVSSLLLYVVLLVLVSFFFSSWVFYPKNKNTAAKTCFHSFLMYRIYVHKNDSGLWPLIYSL